MLKIGQLYLDGRPLAGPPARLLPVGQGVDPESAPKAQVTSLGPYGYLWWVGELEFHPYFSADGSYGQWIIFVPDSRLVVVTVCDESEFDVPTEELANTFNEVIIEPILEA